MNTNARPFMLIFSAAVVLILNAAQHPPDKIGCIQKATTWRAGRLTGRRRQGVTGAPINDSCQRRRLRAARRGARRPFAILGAQARTPHEQGPP